MKFNEGIMALSKKPASIQWQNYADIGHPAISFAADGRALRLLSACRGDLCFNHSIQIE
jgi:hypothetical protein